MHTHPLLHRPSICITVPPSPPHLLPAGSDLQSVRCRFSKRNLVHVRHENGNRRCTSASPPSPLSRRERYPTDERLTAPARAHGHGEPSDRGCTAAIRSDHEATSRPVCINTVATTSLRNSAKRYICIAINDLIHNINYRATIL